MPKKIVKKLIKEGYSPEDAHRIAYKIDNKNKSRKRSK